MSDLRKIRVLILAAGYGTRLLPLTERWPKCLMPIFGRPLLEYWLQIFRSIDADRVLVNTHSHAEIVEDFISSNQFSDWVSVAYEPILLGTARTLRTNRAFFDGYTTMLVHADNWCQCNFSEFVGAHLYRRPSNCSMTMMTFDTDAPETCGIVEIDHNNIVVGFHEKVSNSKGNRASAAVFLLEPEILNWLDANPNVSDFSSEVIPEFLGRIKTWHNTETHRDIGTVASLRAAQQDQITHYSRAPGNKWPRESEFFIEFNNICTNL
jgi:mannose-1-phosphate guanylyltransferase